MFCHTTLLSITLILFWTAAGPALAQQDGTQRRAVELHAQTEALRAPEGGEEPTDADVLLEGYVQTCVYKATQALAARLQEDHAAGDEPPITCCSNCPPTDYTCGFSCSNDPPCTPAYLCTNDNQCAPPVTLCVNGVCMPKEGCPCGLVIDDYGEAKCASCGGEGFVERLKGLFFTVLELFDLNEELVEESGESPVLSHR